MCVDRPTVSFHVHTRPSKGDGGLQEVPELARSQSTRRMLHPRVVGRWKSTDRCKELRQIVPSSMMCATRGKTERSSVLWCTWHQVQHKRPSPNPAADINHQPYTRYLAPRTNDGPRPEICILRTRQPSGEGEDVRTRPRASASVWDVCERRKWRGNLLAGENRGEEMSLSTTTAVSCATKPCVFQNRPPPQDFARRSCRRVSTPR